MNTGVEPGADEVRPKVHLVLRFKKLHKFLQLKMPSEFVEKVDRSREVLVLFE
ncbi:MAG: hypothetical protein JWO82_1935 [Akkermansiaceae bacterium]|nr:hypothetical protein [Akkermansiaceae bacterium]